MKIISTLTIWLLLCLVTGKVHAQNGWQVGIRAGIIGVPYTLSANKLGSGMMLGMYVQPLSTKKLSLSLSLDYRKVDNLLMEKLERSVIVLPDGLYRGSEFLSIFGFTGLRTGLRLDHSVRNFSKGKLKLSIEGYTEYMVVLKASQQSDVSSYGVNAGLGESRGQGIIHFPGGSREFSQSRFTDEDGNIVFSGGAGILYEFDAGPQITCSLQFDLNDRFTLFSGSSDARLTQFQVGFNYPFTTNLIK